MKCNFAILAVLLLAPTAQAYHLSSLENPNGREVDVRHLLLATNTVNLDNAGAGNLMTFTFPWDPEYSYYAYGHTIRIHVSYTATILQDANGAWTVQVAKEATGNLANCAIRVETTNPLGLTLDGIPSYATFNWDCLFTQSNKPHFHYHTVYINRTIASGTPSPISAESVSVRLETEDYILPGTLENITTSRTLETAHHDQLTADLAEHHEDLTEALTGFNATELQRSLAVLLAIRDNSTLLNLSIEHVLAELTDHRQHSLEMTTMNDFNGLGFDGFLILLVLAGIGYFAYRRGLDKHPVWGLVVFLDAIAIITVVLEDQWPFEASLPFKWAIFAMMLAVLLFYVLAGAGFTTGEWLEKRRQRLESKEAGHV